MKNFLGKPHLIEFKKIGKLELGYLTFVENSKLPFEIKRVYWTYFTPETVIRGKHAHYELQQIIFAVSGTIEFRLENITGSRYDFILENPNIGLYIPGYHWREFNMTKNTVLLCLASHEYSEDDYIREYDAFKRINLI